MRSKYFVLISVFLVLTVIRVHAESVTENTALKLYRTAKDMEAKGDYKNAVELLKSAYKIGPNKYIQFHMAIDYFKLRECQQAQDVISKIDESGFDTEERGEVHSALANVLISCNLGVSVSQKGVEAAAAWVVAFKSADTPARQKKVVSRVESYLRQKNFADWIGNLFMQGKAGTLEGFWSMVETIIGSQKTRMTRADVTLALVRKLVNEDKPDYALKALQSVGNFFLINDAIRRYKGIKGLSCDTPDKAAACALSIFAKQDYMTGHCGLSSREFGLITRLYDVPVLRFRFALALLCEGKEAEAKKVLAGIGTFIAPARPADISAAVLRFRQKKSNDVLKLGIELNNCETKSAKMCERNLQKWIKSGRITACQVVEHFRTSAGITSYFNIDCIAENAVSGKPIQNVMAGKKNVGAKIGTKKSLRPYAWSTLAVSGVSLVVGAILLGVAEARLKDLSNNWSKKYQSDAKAQQDSAYKKRAWGWAMVGIGAGAGIASAVLFILEPKHIKVAPSIAGGHPSVNLRLEF